MTPLHILSAVALLLAFVGYVACLRLGFWITLALTMGLAAYMGLSLPFAPEQAMYWIGAAGVFGLALLCLRLLPPKPGPVAPQPRSSAQREVVIDGTNVLYWDGEADLRSLQSVVQYLKSKDILPYVFLDASSRHHLKDPGLTEARFAKSLGLAKKRVFVCPAKTEADAFILTFARENRLPIVSNDRFGDRAQQAKGLKLIKGVIAKGRPILQGL